jgi:hypothetical protein
MTSMFDGSNASTCIANKNRSVSIETVDKL